MITRIAFSFILMLSVTKSDVDFETMCKNDYRNMNNIKINVSKLCSSNTCIEKCCGEGEMFTPKGICENTEELFQRLKQVTKLISDVDYSKIVLYSWNGSVKNKTDKNFVFIKNQRNIDCTSEHLVTDEFFTLQDGSIRIQDTGRSKSWSVIKSLNYCMDFKIAVIERKAQVKLIVRQYNAAPADEDKKSLFVLVGMLISSFFLVLVLVVYCLLPKLQNLIGRVLMAYTSTILVTYLVKIVSLLTNDFLRTSHCKIISPMIYFTGISSFFWMNVMSFDVWWSLRGHRKRCEINRRGERVKFMSYCLYAWGIPLLMTAIVITLDNIDLSNLHIIKPPFDDCFVSAQGVQYYFIVPIGVIIFVNIILFLLTVYNIWMIKSAIHKSPDSRSSAKDRNRFGTYIKLSVLMGVSWCLELVPPDTELWVFILTTAYNLLIGVTIFFLFVFKKRIFLELCKRFNIKNDFIKRFEISQGTRSGTTRTTKVSTKDQTHYMDQLKICPKREHITVDFSNIIKK